MKINWKHVIRHAALRILLPALIGAIVILLLKPKEEPLVGEKPQELSIISGTPASLSAATPDSSQQ